MPPFAARDRVLVLEKGKKRASAVRPDRSFGQAAGHYGRATRDVSQQLHDVMFGHRPPIRVIRDPRSFQVSMSL